MITILQSKTKQIGAFKNKQVSKDPNDKRCETSGIIALWEMPTWN